MRSVGLAACPYCTYPHRSRTSKKVTDGDCRLIGFFRPLRLAFSFPWLPTSRSAQAKFYDGIFSYLASLCLDSNSLRANKESLSARVSFLSFTTLLPSLSSPLDAPSHSMLLLHGQGCLGLDGPAEFLELRSPAFLPTLFSFPFSSLSRPPSTWLPTMMIWT